MFASLTLSLLLSITATDGFQVEVFARGLGRPEAVLALEDGTLLVSRPAMNDVLALRDANGDGIAEEIRTAVASIEQASALAMHGRTLYIAGASHIFAADRLPDGSFTGAREIVAGLPSGGSRSILFGRDGKLYVAIGSGCDTCVAQHPEQATVLQFDADGSNRRIFARGLGDTGGLDWNPRTGDLWGAGDGELNRIGDGLHFGWPYCLGHRPSSSAVAPEGLSKEKLCASTEAAALVVPGGARGLAFYRGTQFPESWRRDAFAASTTNLVRVRFTDDKPVAVDEFVSGAKNIAGVTAATDGSLYFSDAPAGAIYRVSHGVLPRAMTSGGVDPVATPVLAQQFRITDLHGPDSVLHDEEQDVYFVSNLDGAPAAKDGKGFISRITPDGKVADRKFIDGLHAPTGMAIRGTQLWVADVDMLRSFDRVTGAALETVDLAPHGAVFLADVAVGPDESIYVTDTDVRMRGARERLRQGDGRIYRVGDGGSVEVAFRGEELRSPSGIVWDGTRFLIAQAYGNEVLAWNRGMGTKAVLRGPGAYDGIVVLPNGAIIVSSRYDEGLHVGRAGELRPLFARKPSPGGIGFDRKRNRLLIPSADGDWLEAWTLPPMVEPARQTTSREGKTEMAARH
jgi:glucose/arabinose dehydrogenase